MFESIQQGQVDPMFELKKQADSDRSPEKVDFGVGIYRNELGQYHELRCLKKAGRWRRTALSCTDERLNRQRRISPC
jgi:aspartate aminotransferase, cytoplasmic